MKKLRFFGLLAAVLLLVFGLALQGCSNNSTSEDDTRAPVAYRFQLENKQWGEVIIGTQLKGKAAKTGDRYSITLGGTEISSGTVEITGFPPQQYIKFAPTTGDTFIGSLMNGIMEIIDLPLPGGGKETVKAQVPGSGGNIGNPDSVNPGYPNGDSFNRLPDGITYSVAASIEKSDGKVTDTLTFVFADTVTGLNTSHITITSAGGIVNRSAATVTRKGSTWVMENLDTTKGGAVTIKITKEGIDSRTQNVNVIGSLAYISVTEAFVTTGTDGFKIKYEWENIVGNSIEWTIDDKTLIYLTDYTTVKTSQSGTGELVVSRRGDKPVGEAKITARALGRSDYQAGNLTQVCNVYIVDSLDDVTFEIDESTWPNLTYYTNDTEDEVWKDVKVTFWAYGLPAGGVKTNLINGSIKIDSNFPAGGIFGSPSPVPGGRTVEWTETLSGDNNKVSKTITVLSLAPYSLTWQNKTGFALRQDLYHGFDDQDSFSSDPTDTISHLNKSIEFIKTWNNPRTDPVKIPYYLIEDHNIVETVKDSSGTANKDVNDALNVTNGDKLTYSYAISGFPNVTPATFSVNVWAVTDVTATVPDPGMLDYTTFKAGEDMTTTPTGKGAYKGIDVTVTYNSVTATNKQVHHIYSGDFDMGPSFPVKFATNFLEMVSTAAFTSGTNPATIKLKFMQKPTAGAEFDVLPRD